MARQGYQAILQTGKSSHPLGRLSTKTFFSLDFFPIFFSKNLKKYDLTRSKVSKYSHILASTLFSTYENFISQVNLAEQLTSSDFGVSTGLINQPYWEWSRYYFVNVERSNDTDKLVVRNFNISFLNT